MTDTIHALASGPPPAGVAVIRVSGPGVSNVIDGLIARPLLPRAATLVRLRDGNGATLDRALALRFPGPHSFTGEDVLELHCHGGRAVVWAIAQRLVELGSRPAEPGEFTMRAHRNGRIDLIEAERLGDLIEAETEAQRRFAVSSMGRRNAARYEQWRTDLVDLRALVEATLDFADEEDAPVDASAEIADRLGELRRAIADHLSGVRAVEIARDGFRVVLAGAPNAGKSSLLNALAERDVAIVTDTPGTTRDVLEVALDVGGHRVVLSDTAGLRDATDAVEAIGVARARERIEAADLVLQLVPVDVAEDEKAIPNAVRVQTKIDRLPSGTRRSDNALAVSVVTGEGLDSLLRTIGARAADASWREGSAEPDAPVAERHAAHLRHALAHLERAGAKPDERTAEALRLATDELGRITGATNIEDVYGAIFARFCMGK